MDAGILEMFYCLGHHDVAVPAAEHAFGDLMSPARSRNGFCRNAE